MVTKKHTKILGRFVKGCLYISGLFISPFLVVSKSTHFRTKEGANNHEEIWLSQKGSHCRKVGKRRGQEEETVG